MNVQKELAGREVPFIGVLGATPYFLVACVGRRWYNQNERKVCDIKCQRENWTGKRALLFEKEHGQRAPDYEGGDARG